MYANPRNILKVLEFFGFGTKSRSYNALLRLGVNLWFLVCAYLHQDQLKTRPWNAKVLIFTRWLVNISIINCCFGKPSEARSWEDLLNTLDKYPRGATKYATIHTVLLITINICVFIFDFIDISHKYSPKTLLEVSILYLGDFYALLLSIITQHILFAISLRYVALNKDLKNIPSERGDREAERAISEIGSMYYSLHRAMKHFNNIFRWGIFFSLSTFIVQDLMPITYLMNSIKSEERRSFLKFVLGSILFRSISVNYNMVSCVFISEKVEKSGTILDETCHKVILKTTSDDVKEELLALSENLKVLSPRVSAAGFFDVNRKVLPGMVSLITTYAIVDAQFQSQ